MISIVQIFPKGTTNISNDQGKREKSLIFHNLFHLIYIIVEAEDGACKQKCLPNIYQKTVCHVLYGEHLKGYHYDARYYQ